MIKELKRKIAWMNFWAKNKNLSTLLFILFIAIVLLLHTTGIVVLVANDAIY